jgi:hypothetical protein
MYTSKEVPESHSQHKFLWEMMQNIRRRHAEKW